jgi:acyl-CoA-binding protein
MKEMINKKALSLLYGQYNKALLGNINDIDVVFSVIEDKEKALSWKKANKLTQEESAQKFVDNVNKLVRKNKCESDSDSDDE